MNCRTQAVVIIALVAAAAARSGEALPTGRGSPFRTKLDSIRSLPPNLMYYTMMKDPELRDFVNPIPDSEGVRMVGRWCRGPSWNVTGKDTLVYLNLGSECAIINFADPDHPRVLSEIPARDVSPRSRIQDSLLFVAGCGIDIWNVKYPTAPQFLSRINLTVSDIAVQDSYLYAVNADSFCVFDVADPAAPVLVGSSGDTGYTMAVARGYAFVAGVWTMSAIDVSNPTNPHWVGTYNKRVGPMFARDTLVYANLQGPGFEIINVSDPANMRMIGSLPSLEIRGHVYVRDFFAYVPNFAIIDIGDPAHPTIISQCPTPGEQDGVWVRDPWSYAYVADVENGLQVVDIHDPVHPVLDTSILRGGNAQDIAIRSPIAAVATPDAGLRILDISDPGLPHEVGAYDTVGYWWDIYAAAIKDSFVFVGASAAPAVLRSVSVSDPAHPFLAGTSPPSGLWTPWSIIIRGSLLYSAEQGKFQIFDISQPESPTRVSELRTPIDIYGMALHDSFAYMACAFNGLLVLNVAEPTGPRIVDTVPFPGILGGAQDVWIRDSIAYVVAFDTGLKIVNVKNPHAPVVLASLPMKRATGISGTGTEVYVGCADGLAAIDISDPAHPVDAGHYDIPTGCYEIAYDSGLIYALRDDAGLCIFERVPTGVRQVASEAVVLRVTRIPSFGRDRILIPINSKKGGDYRLRIYDVNGRLVIRNTLRLPAGSESVTLDLTALPTGVYFVNVGAEREVRSFKIAKIAE